jgi:hypothetical protein
MRTAPRATGQRAATEPIQSNAMTEPARISDRISNPPVAVERSVPVNELELPLEISFSCHGCQFIANAKDSPGGAVISVEGVVGTIPFSAESPKARAMIRELLAKRSSSEIVWLELAGRNRIELRGQAPLGERPSRAGAVAAVSAVLSAAKPLIDILMDCGACAMATLIDLDGAGAAPAAS